MSPISMISVGRIASTDTGLVPTRAASTAWITDITAIDATALAVAGAVRNIRNTQRYRRAPNPAAISRAIAMAGASPRGPPRSIVLGNPGIGMRSSPSRKYAYVYAM